MGEVGYDRRRTDTIHHIRRVSITVHDKDTIHHGAVFLIGHECKLVANRIISVHIVLLIRREEVVREGHDVEGISFRAGRRSDLTGEDGTIGQRVAAREIRGVATFDLYAVRDNKRIVEGVIHIVIDIMLSRTRRRVPVVVLAAEGTVLIIALEPNLY